MANYTSNLKTWGDTGTEYPDGYSYLAGEQPVDAWDNFFNYNVEKDIDHLITLTNQRLESSVGTSFPGSPENGELIWRSDNSRLSVYDSSVPEWKALAYKSELDAHTSLTNNPHSVTLQQISDAEALLIDTEGSQPAAGTVDRIFVATDTRKIFRDNGAGWDELGRDPANITASDLGFDPATQSELDAHTSLTNNPHSVTATQAGAVVEAKHKHEWFTKQEGGVVGAGDYTPIGTFGLDNGETINVYQAMFTEDGFTTPAPSGAELRIVPEGATVEGDTTAILSGNGTSLYDDQTGDPLVSYTNSSGSHQTVCIALDNGHFGTGTGADATLYGGFIAKIE